MPTKESDEQKKQDLEIDFDIFEKQIDDEIDRLFVPLSAQAEASQDVGPKVEAAQPASGRPISPPPPSPPTPSSKGGAAQPVAERPTPAARPPQDMSLNMRDLIQPAAERQAPPTPPPQDMTLEMRDVAKPLSERQAPPAPPPQDMTLEMRDVAKPVSERQAPPASPPQDMTLEMRDVAKPVAEQAPAATVSEDLSLKETVPFGVKESISEQPLTVMDEPARKPVSAAPEPPRERAPEPPRERAPEPLPSPERIEIGRLVESLSVAYLSLDWDFSIENVAKFEQTLSALAPYCQKAHEARSLYTILKAGLARMSDEPASVSPRIAELIRDSQELLRDLVMAEGSPDTAQKVRFKELIDRARTMKNEGLLGRRPQPQPEPVVARRPLAEVERIEETGAGLPIEAAAEGGQSLDDFRVWMNDFRSRSNEAAQKLQDESRRLLQVEQILGRTPALAPVVARMSQIRSTLEAQVASHRENDREWERQIRRLAGLEAGIQERLARSPVTPVEVEMTAAPAEAPAVAPAVAPAEGPAVAPVVAPAVAPAEPAAEETGPAQPEPSVFQASVYTYRISGKRFALLSSNVVKISEVSSKKANRIRARGHATLADLKPFLRSVKTGVMGAWSDISPQRLKVYEFLLLPYRMLRASAPPSIVGTAILVSNGDHHGVVFAEPDSVQYGEEAIKGVQGEKGVIGVIESEKSPAVEVLNMDEILRDLHESSAAGEAVPE